MPNAEDHYFTARPASPDERRVIDVRLADRNVQVEVAPGIFSPGGIDKGTKVLLAHAPDPRSHGDFLDLGCGWGPIALTLALRAPDAEIWAVDVNERSLDLTRRNAERLGLPRIHATAPDGIPDQEFDLIWSNPPVRVGKAVLHDLLQTWLPRLRPGGQAFLVVQKNLGSDSLQRWLADTFGATHDVARHATGSGFRVLRVDRRVTS